MALIPARGGSKGIPRKNIREFAGKPLIAYSIEQALACPSITRTIVSTDDEEIAAVALQYGAEVPFMRPREFATDDATDLSLFQHILLELVGRENYSPELIVQLRPTGPIRSVERIEQAIMLMSSRPDADSLKTVSAAKLSPYKMWRMQGDLLEPLLEVPGLPEAHSMPRQILPTVYTGNGYLDVVRPRSVLHLNSMVGRVVLPLILEEPTFDLDYPEQIPELENALRKQGTLARATTRSLSPTGTGRDE